MSERYKPVEKTAADGKSWWYPYDTKESKFSTLLAHYKCKTRKECQQLINKVEAKELFKRIYPEDFVKAYVTPIDNKNCLIEGHFPDGVFFFVANGNSLSASYDTRDEAVKAVKKETRAKDAERE